MKTRQNKVWLWIVTAVIFVNGGMVFQQTACAGIGNFKAALLLPRAVDADGWTKAGYAGLLLIEKELQAEIAYSESVPEEEFEQVFRQYAQEDFDFIIGHGGQFVSAAEIVAEEFPRTKFAVVTKYAGNNKNLGALFMREGELSYLVGVIAALKTETGKIGYAGGERYAANVENAELFERGGKDTNPDIQVVLEWAGTWTDQQKIEQMAQQQIDSGADVLSVNAGQGGLAIHALAEKIGVSTIGWIEDYYDLAPGAVITSVVMDYPRLIVTGATLAREGRWEGKQYKFGMREEALHLAPFRGMLTPEQEARVQAVQNDIMQGKIDLTP